MVRKSMKDKFREFIIEADLATGDLDVSTHQEDAAYISTKERNSPTTKYIDESRKSFPYRKGKECIDLKAASRAFGRYKGSMTHDAFVAKVKRLMAEHGCAIPTSWQNK